MRVLGLLKSHRGKVFSTCLFSPLFNLASRVYPQLHTDHGNSDAHAQDHGNSKAWS